MRISTFELYFVDLVIIVSLQFRVGSLNQGAATASSEPILKAVQLIANTWKHPPACVGSNQ